MRNLVEVTQFTQSETYLNKIINAVASDPDEVVEVVSTWDPNYGVTRRLLYVPDSNCFVMGLEPTLPGEKIESWTGLGDCPKFKKDDYQNDQWWIKSVLLAWEREVKLTQEQVAIPRSLFLQIRNAVIHGDESPIDQWNISGVSANIVKRHFHYSSSDKSFVISDNTESGTEGRFEATYPISATDDSAISSVAHWYLTTRNSDK